jgi:DNA-binding helix-hairpin-helix protein with protein kinase domain
MGQVWRRVNESLPSDLRKAHPEKPPRASASTVTSRLLPSTREHADTRECDEKPLGLLLCGVTLVTALILVVMLVLLFAVTYTTGTFEALGSFLCNLVHMKMFQVF